MSSQPQPAQAAGRTARRKPFVRLLLIAMAATLAGALGWLAISAANGPRIVASAISSPYEQAATQVRVLLPGHFSTGHRYRVVYLLPVSPRTEERAEYGDALQEVRQIQKRHGYDVIFVMPTLSETPWYGDHAANPAIRQESYIVRTVVPFIDRTYPTIAAPDGRYLLGFSKSGWGAWSLLLRNPDVFGRALEWDAPLMMDKLGQWDSPTVFGSEANFERYRISGLVETRGPQLGPEPRLFMAGASVFDQDGPRMHALLQRLGVPHVYRQSPRLKHHWRSGWMEAALSDLVAERPAQTR